MYFITYSDLLTYPESYYTDGVKAITYSGERFLPQAKTSNLLMQYMAKEEAARHGAFEALLVNRSGLITEGTRTNFYIINGNRLITAPDSDVLSGITRISVIEAASQLGLDIEYRAVSVKEAYGAESAFISSTSMAALPLSAIDSVLLRKQRWDLIRAIKDLVRRWE